MESSDRPSRPLRHPRRPGSSRAAVAWDEDRARHRLASIGGAYLVMVVVIVFLMNNVPDWLPDGSLSWMNALPWFLAFPVLLALAFGSSSARSWSARWPAVRLP